jgi:hypothetical protein
MSGLSAFTRFRLGEEEDEASANRSSLSSTPVYVTFVYLGLVLPDICVCRHRDARSDRKLCYCVRCASAKNGPSLSEVLDNPTGLIMLRKLAAAECMLTPLLFW